MWILYLHVIIFVQHSPLLPLTIYKHKHTRAPAAAIQFIRCARVGCTSKLEPSTRSKRKHYRKTHIKRAAFAHFRLRQTIFQWKFIRSQVNRTPMPSGWTSDVSIHRGGQFTSRKPAVIRKMTKHWSGTGTILPLVLGGDSTADTRLIVRYRLSTDCRVFIDPARMTMLRLIHLLITCT